MVLPPPGSPPTAKFPFRQMAHTQPTSSHCAFSYALTQSRIILVSLNFLSVMPVVVSPKPPPCPCRRVISRPSQLAVGLAAPQHRLPAAGRRPEPGHLRPPAGPRRTEHPEPAPGLPGGHRQGPVVRSLPPRRAGTGLPQ